MASSVLRTPYWGCKTIGNGIKTRVAAIGLAGAGVTTGHAVLVGEEVGLAFEAVGGGGLVGAAATDAILNIATGQPINFHVGDAVVLVLGASAQKAFDIGSLPASRIT